METILAIDPGPDKSAYVIYGNGTPVSHDKVDNSTMLAICRGEIEFGFDILVIEQIAAMGMAVGAEVFETVFWSGRFAQAWGGRWHRVKRHEVKMHLCGNMRAKDANIRQAIIDRFGPGKEIAIGTKRNPGPLYKVSGDCWSALAVAVTYADRA